MSSKNSTIEKLKKNEKLLDEVLQWITSKGFDKKWKKCVANSVDDCVGVGLANTFHGKRCQVCTRAYKKEKWWENKEKKKEEEDK